MLTKPNFVTKHLKLLVTRVNKFPDITGPTNLFQDCLMCPGGGQCIIHSKFHAETLQISYICLQLLDCTISWQHSNMTPQYDCHALCWISQWRNEYNFGCHDSSVALAGGKHFQKTTIPILRLVPQICPISSHFPYLLSYHYLFSLLSSCWFVVTVCGSISVRN